VIPALGVSAFPVGVADPLVVGTGHPLAIPSFFRRIPAFVVHFLESDGGVLTFPCGEIMVAAMKTKTALSFEETHTFVDNVFGQDMHAKRVTSLSNATLGVVNASSLAIHMIGEGLAQARDLTRKHCIKQVDRLFGNDKLKVWDLFSDWVPYIVAERKQIVVAMDWTEFDADDHSSIVLSMVTGHGRSTPLLWKTVKKSVLKGKRNSHEDAVLRRLREVLPEGVSVTIVADRGFGDQKLYEFLQCELGFGYLIRFRDNIYVTDEQGECRQARDWVPRNGRIKVIRQAKVTDQGYVVPTVVCVKKKDMKDAWCLAVSDPQAKGRETVNLYGKRWGIETSFRDIKDYKFGMGMAHMHTRSTDRRDRLFLVSALAIALLTLLGAAGDAVGLERTIKANTSKSRTYSFFRQGCIYYNLLPGMREEWATPLMNKFYELVREQSVFRNAFGII
jgi:hypothetical protein